MNGFTSELNYIDNLPEDWTQYRQLRNLVTSMNRKARKIHFYTKLKETRAGPNVFWNTLRKVISGKNNFGEIEKLVINRKEVKDKQNTANSLNEFFTTMASSLLSGCQPWLQVYQTPTLPLRFNP